MPFENLPGGSSQCPLPFKDTRYFLFSVNGVSSDPRSVFLESFWICESSPATFCFLCSVHSCVKESISATVSSDHRNTSKLIKETKLICSMDEFLSWFLYAKQDLISTLWLFLSLKVGPLSMSPWASQSWMPFPRRKTVTVRNSGFNIVGCFS